MCGRYTLKAPREAIAEAFDLADVPQLLPRYNIAPTQPVPVVRLDPGSGERGLAFLQWGLIPSWADDPAIGNRLINARAETVAEKPAFRTAFKKRRCLVPADGFYEWKRENGKAPITSGSRTRAPSRSPGSGSTGRRATSPSSRARSSRARPTASSGRCITECRSSSSPKTTPDGSTPSGHAARLSCGCSPRSPMIGYPPIRWGNW